MNAPTQEAADRHHKREAVALAIQRFSTELAQQTDTEPVLLVEALVMATATTCIDLAKEGMRRDAVVHAAELLLHFSRKDAPWIEAETENDH